MEIGIQLFQHFTSIFVVHHIILSEMAFNKQSLLGKEGFGDSCQGP